MATPSRVLKCHEGDCVSCSLCKKGNPKFIHPCHIKLKALPTYKWIKEHCPNLSEEACICQPCFKQIKRNLGNPAFTPRWSPKPPKPTKACCIDQCKFPAYTTTNLVTAEQLQSMFENTRVTSFSVSASASLTSLVLCKDHYLVMYHKLNAPTPCCSCGAKPKKGTSFNRHCTSPKVISEYLSNVSGDPLNLTATSAICYTCYMHFSSILKQLQHADAVPELVPLDTIIKQLSVQKASIECKGESITKDEFADLVLCITGMKLAESMKIDEVVLLPDLYDFFCEEMNSCASHYPSLGQITAEMPGTRWVLSHLSFHFGQNLRVECRHRRFGSLLYHPKCDLLKAVSLALGRNRLHKVPSEPPKSPPQQTIDEQITFVALYLNERVHMQAKTFVANFQDKPERYASFSIDWLYEAVDPNLLSFVQQLTQTVRSRRRRLFNNDTEITATKRMRQAYLLCTILFCSNAQCSMPFHSLLTESILCHGGSQELIRILNRVGAVASLETNRRLATLVVQQRMSSGIVSDLQPKSFSVVSIDNIDILQSHAFVSSTDGTRSWHGTSVQCTQPLPLSALLSNDEMTAPSYGRKHGPSLSPPASPVPIAKSKRRRRTLTEQLSPHTRLVNSIESVVDHQFEDLDHVEYDAQAQSHFCMSEFKLNQAESEAIHKLQGDIFNCMILKYVHLNNTDCKLPGLQSLINCVAKQTSSCEVSNVVYVEILSELADSKPTLNSILGRLHKTFIQELGHKWVLVVGDAKVFVLLQEIKSQYGSHLGWMLPFPGDWHILYNYQPALMKPYADAGLAKLAETSGHRSETLTSLLQCKNFRRTHNFFMQAFEAFYIFFLTLYFKNTQHETLQREVSDLITEFSRITTDSELDSFRERVQTVVSCNVNYEGFKECMEAMAKKQDTIRFWYRFVTEDCFAYFALFVGIRYRNWDLRMASLKQQAAIFSAFDRSTYQRLVPTHIGDVLRMPEAVLQHLRKGSFSIRFTKTEWHGVALDECHEMKINKDAKLAIVRPSKERMEFLSNYMAFQAKSVRNLIDQIFPEQCEATLFTHKPTSKDRKAHVNMQRMQTILCNHGMFYEIAENQGLWNVLAAKKATEEQQHDLMNFRTIGQQGFEQFIERKYLKTASTNAPVRQKRLCTFSVTHTQKRKIQLIEKEQKQYQRYLKRTLAWVAEHGTESIDAEALFRPIQSVPRALIDANGFPYKSTKSSTTTFFQQRYKNPKPITDRLPYGWIPDTVIMEGMFMIQTAPLPTMSCMKEYSLLLINRFVRPHFAAGAMSVHVVFDTPGSLPENPKELEQRRRDKAADTNHHSCTQFGSDSVLPCQWRSIISCRICKERLISYIADEMLLLVQHLLHGTQEFTTNLKQQAFTISSTKTRTLCPAMTSNADEADLRVWLHCKHSRGTKVLIYSPDTDVYHIGMTKLSSELTNMDVIVQLSKSFTENPKFIYLNKLLACFNADPDLASLPETIRPQLMQAIYISTGCDYISFFWGIGKVSFLATFFQYTSFIAEGTETVSCLFFLRLVGCAYYRKYASAFASQKPETLFNSIPASNTQEKHVKWLQTIRTTVHQHAERERNCMPSTEALELHWQRCMWVTNFWKSAMDNKISLPELTKSGWRRDKVDGRLEVHWEVEENVHKAQASVDFMLSGCRCKSGCSTKRCSCQKRERVCGPSCQCYNCSNVHKSQTASTSTVQEEMETVELLELMSTEKEIEEEYVEESDYDNDDDDEEQYLRLEREVDEIMKFVFGEESDDDEP